MKQTKAYNSVQINKILDEWKRRGNNMAKRRGFFKRAASRARTVTRYVRSKARRGTKRYSGMSVKPIQLDAMAYGAVRPYANGITAPVVDIVDNYIPSDIAQPLVNGAALWAISKYSSGMIKQVASKALTCENYEMGKAVGNRFLGTTTTSNNTQGIVLG